MPYLQHRFCPLILYFLCQLCQLNLLFVNFYRSIVICQFSLSLFLLSEINKSNNNNNNSNNNNNNNNNCVQCVANSF